MTAPDTGSDRSQLIGQFAAETIVELDRMDEWELEILEADPGVALQASTSRMAVILKSRNCAFEVFRDAIFHSRLGADTRFSDAYLDEYLRRIWLAAPVGKDPSGFYVAADSINASTVKALTEHLLQAPGPREAKLLVAVLLTWCEAACSFETIAKTNVLATAVAEHMDDVDRGLEIAQEAGMLRVSKAVRGQFPTINIGGWFWHCAVGDSQKEAQEALILPDDILFSERLPDASKQLYEYLTQSTDFYEPGDPRVVHLIAMDNEVGGSERTYDCLQPLVTLGLVEQDSDDDEDLDDVSGLYFRLTPQPDRLYAADLLDLFRSETERRKIDEARSREVHSEMHIQALSVARKLAEVIFLEECGERIPGGRARMSYAKECAAEELQSWTDLGGEDMDWVAATGWMIERMACGIDERFLRESRRKITEMAESKECDTAAIKFVRDKLIFDEWLNSRYPDATESNARFWRSDRYEPYPMPDFRL